MKIVGYLLCCIFQRQCNSSVHTLCGNCEESTAANTYKAHSFMPVTGLCLVSQALTWGRACPSLRCTLSLLSLSLTHVMCNSSNCPVPSTVPFSLPSTELRDSIHPGSMSPSNMIQEVTLVAPWPLGRLWRWAHHLSTLECQGQCGPGASEETVMDRQVRVWLTMWWNDVNRMVEQG